MKKCDECEYAHGSFSCNRHDKVSLYTGVFPVLRNRVANRDGTCKDYVKKVDDDSSDG